MTCTRGIKSRQYQERKIPESLPPRRKYGQHSEGKFLDASLCVQACTHMYADAHAHKCTRACTHAYIMHTSHTQAHRSMQTHVFTHMDSQECMHTCKKTRPNAHMHTGPRLGWGEWDWLANQVRFWLYLKIWCFVHMDFFIILINIPLKYLSWWLSVCW